MEKTGFTKGVFVKKDYNNYGDEIISVSVKIEDFKSNPISLQKNIVTLFPHSKK